MITQSRTFRSVAEAVAPGAQALDEPAWQRVGAIIEQALAQRPPAVRRQLTMFLRVLNLFAVARHGHALAALPVERRVRFLERIEKSRLLLFRRGFWGLRTLILMGYYARPEARAEVGYRAHALGWRSRQ